MTTEKLNRIQGLVFSLTACLLFPPLLIRVFSDHGAGPLIWVISWAIFLLFLAYGILLLAQIVRSRTVLVNCCLMVASLLGLWYGMFALDRAVGGMLYPNNGLVFPPKATMTIHSSEFTMRAEIGSDGLRKVPGITQKDASKVLVIGDSFAFGWGVDDSATWVSKLQQQLPNYQFNNAGKPGISTGGYVQIAQKTLATVQPDELVVTVLLGEDLAQLVVYEASDPDQELPPSCKRKHNAMRFPHLARWLGINPSIDVAQHWKCEAGQVLARVKQMGCSSPEQILDREMYQHFSEGRVNPSRVYRGLCQSSRFSMLEDTADDRVKNGLEIMRRDFVRLKSMTDKASISLKIVLIPFQGYSCAASRYDLAALGYDLPVPTAHGQFLGVMGVEQVLNDLDIPFYNATPALVDECNSGGLFFPLDGHLTASGNQLLANSIKSELFENQ